MPCQGRNREHTVMEEHTVLLVEDDEHARAALKEELGEHGIGVIEAGSIEAAIQAIRCDGVDAVVLDMRMPPDELAGLRLLRSIFHFGIATVSVPIIVFTGFESYENCVAAMKAGAADYMPKRGTSGTNPVAELVRRCEKLMDEPRTGSAETTLR